MTVHYKKKCLIVDNVHCLVPAETKWNSRQPMLTMQGWATEVKVINNWAFIR